MRVVETPNETERAVKQLRMRLRDISKKLDVLEWSFPNGERADYPTYTLDTYRGELQVGVPESWGNRIPHLFRFVKKQSPSSPDVEVNIPNELNRKVSGVYVKTEVLQNQVIAN